MTSRKMKLLSAAIGAVALIATSELARTVHKGAAPAEQAYHQARGANAVVGPDGKLIGAAPDPSVRSQLQRDGLPE
jgi:hypothetical protein